MTRLSDTVIERNGTAQTLTRMRPQVCRAGEALRASESEGASERGLSSELNPRVGGEDAAISHIG